MSNQEIYEEIDKIVKNRFPGLFQVKVWFRSPNVFDNVAELTIEKIEQDGINEVVLHETFLDLSKSIENQGQKRFFDKIDTFLFEKIEKSIHCERGDIVWSTRVEAFGSEQDGKRPYLIVSNNTNNRYSPILTCVPLTSKSKKDLPTHYKIKIGDVENTVLCEQITAISKKDICGFARRVTTDEMKNIEKCIQIQLALYKGESNKNSKPAEEKVKKQGLIAKLRAYFNKRREKRCEKTSLK